MKNIKKILTLGLGLGLLGGSLVAVSAHGAKKVAEADAWETHHIDYDKFVSMKAENLVSDQFPVGEILRNGNEGFWSGRYYGTNERVLDTVDLKGGDHGEIRTHLFTQQSNKYISFLMGGNSDGDIFINIWNEGKGDVHANIKNIFFKDPETSLNMCFRYFLMPNGLSGDTLIYFHKYADGNCRGITFSNLRINQSFDEVVTSYRNYLDGYALSAKRSAANKNAYDRIMDLHENDSYYAELKTALNNRAALTNVNDDFETNNNGLSNWVVDYDYTTGYFTERGIFSNAPVKKDDYFYVEMPFNQTNSYFLNEDAIGFPEDQKYRLVSPAFNLGGVGLISAKLGGGTAVLELLDAETFDVLATTKQVYSTFEGQDIYNPGFNYPSGERPELDMFGTGARLNTMSRVYLDCHEYKFNDYHKQVRVALTDGRTGGGWGKAYFDDVVTNYDSYPTFKAEALAQTKYDGENVVWTHYGVVTDHYVGSNSIAFGKAYGFVRSFWDSIRSLGSEQSWCSHKEDSSTEYASLINAYNGLSSDAKNIADASVDYAFISGNVRTAYLTTPVNVADFTVGNTMSAIITGVYPSSNSQLFNSIGNNKNNDVILLIAISIISASLMGTFISIKKKRKVN